MSLYEFGGHGLPITNSLVSGNIIPSAAMLCIEDGLLLLKVNGLSFE